MKKIRLVLLSHLFNTPPEKAGTFKPINSCLIFRSGTRVAGILNSGVCVCLVTDLFYALGWMLIPYKCLHSAVVLCTEVWRYD